MPPVLIRITSLFRNEDTLLRRESTVAHVWSSFGECLSEPVPELAEEELFSEVADLFGT